MGDARPVDRCLACERRAHGFLHYGVETTGEPHGGLLAIAAIAMPIVVLLLTGFFTLQPNQARVLVLFGAYKGTVRTAGFHWGNPFYSNGPQQAASWRA